ncbi:MAG: hypothetical protein AB7H43_15305 [Acidimicrobiia bacterium]
MPNLDGDPDRHVHCPYLGCDVEGRQADVDDHLQAMYARMDRGHYVEQLFASDNPAADFVRAERAAYVAKVDGAT